MIEERNEMGTLTVRKALESDRKDIAKTYAEAFLKDWQLLSKDVNVIANGLTDGLKLAHYIVAIEDEVLVGFLAFVEKDERAFHVPIKSFQKAFGFFKGFMMAMALRSELSESLGLRDDTIYIDVLGVRKAAQGKGIGTKLIQYVFANTSANTYTLTVTKINMAAQHCYDKNGFIQYDRKPVKYAKQKGFSEMIYMEYQRQH